MIYWQTQFWGNSLEAYAIFLGILLFGLAVGKLVSWLIQHVIKAFAAKTETKLDDVFVEVCDGPLVFAIFVGTLALAERFLTYAPTILHSYDVVLRVLFVITGAWFVIRFLDSVINQYLVPYAQKSESDLDDVLIPILHTIVKVVVMIIAGIMVFSDFGYDVTGLVAGLGIGGLAIAFAAKDILGNMFGGFSILTDKPFKIGDMVKLDSKQGTVREIGIRTTRVETLDGTQLIIPNQKFTEGIIENVTRRKQHRVSLALGLQYDTSSKKLKDAKDIVRAVIKKHKGTKDDPAIAFNNFGPSSIDIAVYYFITDLKNIMSIQDEINTAIKEQFEKAKIEFAYPTQTVILKK